VVFIDVRGFTALSERLPPRDAVTRLNRFYNLAAQTVFRLDGTLDKLIGDQVMAFFGAPFRSEDHQARAVQAALDIVSAVEAMAGDGESLHVGGGVATGEMFMGNVGEGEVQDITVIGDVVNTPARVQAAAGPGEVLATEETYRQVAQRFADAPQRILEVKGKSAPLTVRVLRSGHSARDGSA
jgi:adenylate cyclase